MKQITYEEFKAEIDEMCKELMVRKKAQKKEAGVSKRVNSTSKPYIPPYDNHYEYLHAYDLDSNETENGAKYDSCRWRYKQCTEPAPWEKCWVEDYWN